MMDNKNGNNRISIYSFFYVLMLVLCVFPQTLYVVTLLAIVFFLYVIIYRKLSINRYSFSWFLFPIGIMISGGVWQGGFLKFLLLALVIAIKKEDTKNSLDYTSRLVTIIGLIVAFSVILEKIYPSFFFKYLYIYYPDVYRESLQEQVKAGTYYTGICHEVSIAATLISYGFIFAFFSESKRGNNKIIKLVILGVAVVLTGKRTHVLALILCIWLYYTMVSKEKKRLLIGGTIIFALMLVISFLPFVLKSISSNSAIYRIVEVFSIFEGADDINILNRLTSGRLSSYDQAWTLFLRSPLFGNGWYYFSQNVYNTYLGTHLTNVHNIYLQLLCDSGIVGFLSFMIPAGLYLYISLKMAKEFYTSELATINRLALVLQFFFLVSGMAGTQFDSPNFYIIYYMALMMVNSVISEVKSYRKL